MIPAWFFRRWQDPTETKRIASAEMARHRMRVAPETCPSGENTLESVQLGMSKGRSP